MNVETKSFDPAVYLDTDEARAEYMTAALETEDPAFIADALGVIARARGMTKVAGEAQLSREHLYRSLSDNGNPELATVRQGDARPASAPAGGAGRARRDVRLYPITTKRSLASIWAPGVDQDLADRAVLGGVQGRLHLHRLDGEQRRRRP